MDVSTDAYSDSVSAASSSESSHSGEGGEDSYFWQMLTFGYTVEWCVPAPHLCTSLATTDGCMLHPDGHGSLFAMLMVCTRNVCDRAACKERQCPICSVQVGPMSDVRSSVICRGMLCMPPLALSRSCLVMAVTASLRATCNAVSGRT